MATVALVFLVLFLATALYAWALACWKHLFEPDLTWLEVVIGVSLCLLAPAALARLTDAPTWESYERWVWLAFVVGGAPIVIWRIGAAVRAWRAVEARLRGATDGRGGAASLAEERGSGAADDD